MTEIAVEPPSKSRLACLLDHFAMIPDPRDPRYVAHPLNEIMFLVVCGTICDCDDFELIADWARRIWCPCAASCPMIMACPAGAGSTS